MNLKINKLKNMVAIKISLSELINLYYSHQDSKLMKEILFALSAYSEEWEELGFDLNVFKPKCEVLGYCPERKGCGRKGKKEC